MPYRNVHNCTVNEDITENLETIKKKVKSGVLEFVVGTNPTGGKGTRAIRIPAYISVNEANRICNVVGGQFSPATPLDPKKQLLKENPSIGCFYSWVKDFEMPVDEVKLSEVELPVSDRCFLDGHRELPYKYPDGRINLNFLKSSLFKINKINLSAELKLVALWKLLRLCNVYGIRLKEKAGFKMSDLKFYLMVLSEYEEKEEADANTKSA